MSVHILFVCLGNICRSPSAEGIFRDLVSKAEYRDHIEVDSAGTGAWHIGNPPDKRAQKVALERGVDIRGLKARQVHANDFERFDLIVAMDASNRDDLLAACPDTFARKISMLLDHAPDQIGQDVPDPYYGGEDGFHLMFDLIEQGAKGLLDHVARKHLSSSNKPKE